MRMLRAYVCTGPECGYWAMDAAGYVANRGRTMLMLPARWLAEPESAASPWSRQAARDAKAVEAAGVKSFPVILAGIGDDLQVYAEGDWNRLKKEGA